MLGVHVYERERRGAGRRPAIAALALATLLACAGQASAQTPDDSGAVDQYVEDIPTAGGSAVPGREAPKQKGKLKPSVAASIDSDGGADAPALAELATSPDYGAGAKLGRSKGSRLGVHNEVVESGDPELDVSNRAALTSAVSAAQGAGTARLAGFLAVLFGISVATLGAAALRHRRGTLA
jgi:hypothetical protein